MGFDFPPTVCSYPSDPNHLKHSGQTRFLGSCWVVFGRFWGGLGEVFWEVFEGFLKSVLGEVYVTTKFSNFQFYRNIFKTGVAGPILKNPRSVRIHPIRIL